jgi:hypothetical protein
VDNLENISGPIERPHGQPSGDGSGAQPAMKLDALTGELNVLFMVMSYRVEW